MCTVEDYDEAIEKAGRFLRTRQNTDGSVKGIKPDTFWGYYTQPLALRGTGSSEDWSRANRCIDYIKKTFLNSDGSFKLVTEPRWKKKVVAGDLYAATYMIHGASLWERFDVAGPSVKYVLRFQDKESGGIFYRTKDPRFIDPSVTANGGIGMILTGYLKEAKRAGDFFVNLHNLQPDMDNRYLTIWDTKRKGLLTDYENVKGIPDSIQIRENPNNANAYWDSGYIMVFMVYLYHATGDKEYLRVARELFGVISKYKDFEIHVWKTPWACARLYQATGDQRCLEAARTMADRIVSMQQEDGSIWSESKSSYSELQSDVVTLVDMTCQLAYFLSEVRAVL
jgi:hypothetical protein